MEIISKEEKSQWLFIYKKPINPILRASKVSSYTDGSSGLLPPDSPRSARCLISNHQSAGGGFNCFVILKLVSQYSKEYVHLKKAR